MITAGLGYLFKVIRKSFEKNRPLFMGKADQSQTESFEVLINSEQSYEQLIIY